MRSTKNDDHHPQHEDVLALSAPTASLGPGAPEGQIDRLVRLAHEHLQMGAVYVSEFKDGKQVYRAVAGEAASFGLSVGDGPGLAGTYCALMTAGDLPNVVPDSLADTRTRDLPITVDGSIGAYVGVPLYLPTGELYGSFCGVSHAADLSLNGRDAHFMAMLAAFVAEELTADQELRAQHAGLQQVLDTRAVAIALQPVVDLDTGLCRSLEALTRFAAPYGAPDGVLALAERVGLRHELETLAVAEAVKLLPMLAPDQSLAVNLSPDVALALIPLTEQERPLDRLILEITEHAAVESYVEIRESLQPLRERGLRLAIDDAGAGYASLRHIIELQPDIIKIDRALVSGIDTDMARRSALTTFALLALDTGAKVVAEGVETHAELTTVAALGVDAAQGYLLARPSSDPAEIRRWTSGARLLTDGDV